jgi:hypothetical protein
MMYTVLLASRLGHSLETTKPPSSMTQAACAYSYQLLGFNKLYFRTTPASRRQDHDPCSPRCT